MELYAGFEPQVGEIRAVRTFRLGAGGVLYPLFSATPWVDGANTARCRIAGDGAEPHLPPESDCSCGFYAYGSEAAARENPSAEHVLAVVACWGRVIAGTRGVRAEHCRVEAIWMSDIVPAALAAEVASANPSVAIFTDRNAMLDEFPVTQLDCYEPDSVEQVWMRRALHATLACAVVIGTVPFRLIDGVADGRVIWGALLAFFLLASLVLARRPPTDVVAQRRRLLFFAVALWLVADLGGAAGLIFLRLPLLQIATITAVQRSRIRRAASRFPAEI